jgi:OmcA/MtrC family decaheme c-type cytochrome
VADSAAGHDAVAAAALAQGSISVNSVTVDTSTAVRKPVIRFTLKDDKGQAVAGYTRFRFTVAKLVPADGGEPDKWVAYVNNSSKKPTSEYSYGTSTPKGTIVEVGGGVYEYTFATDLAAVTTPVTVAYDGSLPHRIGIQTGDSTFTNPATGATVVVASNGFADFTPDVAAPLLATSRDIATTAGCNACHGKLTIHGRRTLIPFCVTCHNKGGQDSGGSAMDMTVMVHRIHGAAVVKNPYSLGGHDYSHVGYPQDVRDCTTCHTGANADVWKTKPSAHACTSCHDDLVFAGTTPGANQVAHPFSVAATANCASCHSATGITSAHARVDQLEAAKIRYEIIEITNTAPGEFPVVKFKVVNPADSTPYDIKTHAYFTQPNGASSLGVLIGWSNADYRNVGTNANYGQVVNINALTAAVANGDGTFTVTSTVAVPADATGSGTVAIQGHPAAVVDGASVRIPVKNVSKAFKITDTSPAARRSVVSIDKCNACHGNLSLHGSNRTGDITTCTMCHNGEATDRSKRPATGTTADGKVEESIDFKTMIHAIHGNQERAAGIVVYGYGSSVNDFSHVAYPNVLANCQACHVAGTYAETKSTTGVTVGTGADAVDVTDNLRTTKQAAVCSSCHQNALVKSHMQQNGGAFGATQAQIDSVE